MLLISLAGHLLLTLLFLFSLRGHYRPPATEAYRVDLVALPVASPRAGRPDAVVAEKPAPAPRPAPPAKAAPSVAKPTPLPGKGAKKSPTAKSGPLLPAADGDYDAAQDRIERLRRRQEIADLQARITAMQVAERQRKSSATAPAGVTDGKGSELGASYNAYIHKSVQEAWVLSRYQVSNLDREAVVELTFNAKGTLSGYRVLKGSGDERFDDSVRRAVLNLVQLPTAPGRAFTTTVRFNLKELLER
jgi:TonB family protein